MSTITSPKTHKGLIALFLMALLFSFEATAQNEVAIGSTTTKSNAILWLNGNGSQGLILPVVTNKSAVSNPDKGMVVYDDSDNKVWYRSSSAWVEVGSGTGSSTANLNLLLQGNQLQLRDGTTVQSTVNIAGGTQSNGAFLVFTGGSWQYATLSGDVTGANGALQVNGIKGKTIATLPATTQALVYDPTANAGAGGWSFQTLTSGGTVTNITGTSPVTVTNPTTTPTISIATGGITNTLVATDAVNSSKIQDATITGADIAGSTITTDKLAQSAATTGQVLKWNGTNWVPQNETTSTTTILSNGQILTGNGTANAATTLSGDATLSGGAITIGNNAITTVKINAAAVDATKLADNAVTNTKVAVGANIDVSKLNGGAINENKVLKVVGGVVTYATDEIGATGTGDITDVLAGTGLTGGATAGSATLNVDVGTTASKIIQLDGTGKLPAVDGSQLTNLPAGTTYTAGTGISIAGTVVTNTGDTNAADDLTTASSAAGDVTGLFSNLQIAAGAVTTTELATNAVDATKLADNAVTNTKVAAGANIDVSKLNGGAINENKVLKVVGGVVTYAADEIGATGTGDITDVVAGTGLTGGATAGSATLNVDVGTTANKIVQLNGTGKLPAVDGSLLTNLPAGTTYTAGTGISIAGTVVTNTGDTNAADDLTTASSAAGDVTGLFSNLQIAPGAVTTTEITDASITGADLAANIAISTTGNVSVNAPGIISGIGSGLTTLNATNISSGSLALARITAGTNGQVLTTTAGVPAWQTPVTGTTTLDGLTDATVTAASSGQILVNDGAGQFRNVSASGDATISNSGAVTLANSPTTRTNLGLGTLATLSAVDLTGANVAGILPVANGGTGRSTWNGLLLGSAGNISDISTGTAGQFLRVVGTSPSWQTFAVTSADITDGTITDADINGSAAIAGTKVSPIFGTQNISTSGTLSAGATTVSGLTIGTSVWPANASGSLTNDGTGSLTWAASSGWGLTGNASTVDGTNFIGTTDAIPLNFRVNNLGAGRIESAAGTANTLFGYQAGSVNTGIQNAAVGYQAMQSNAAGQRNAALGYRALFSNTTGNGNTAVGQNALLLNTTGGANAAFGTGALANNTGSTNTAVGNSALGANTTASDNAAVGTQSLSFNTIGASNSALGSASLINNTTGSNNTGVGLNALQTNTTGSSNTAVGYRADVLSSALTNATAIGANAMVEQSNSLVLGSINGVNGATASINVGIGTTTPRGKLEIQRGDLILSGSPGTAINQTDPPDINFVILDGTIKSKIWTAQTTNTLYISTSTDPTNNRYFTLDPSGNFGFSSTSPTEKVDITGNVRFSGALMPNNSAGTAGQVLASAGAGLPPTWTNASGATLINNTGTNNLFAGDLVATAGTDNAFFGYQTGAANTGNFNVFMGTQAAQFNTTGSLNTKIGWYAGRASTTANGNTMVGAQAGQNSTGGTNTFIGEKSGQANTSGTQSVFIGNSAGLANTTGAQNVIIGNTANVGASGLTNAIAIGYGSTVSASNSMVLGNNVNVGMGTSAPINKLDVEGGVAIGATYSGTSTAPTNGMIVQGNFGLGTPAPINKLDVEGGVAIGATYSGTSTAPTNGLIVQGNVGIGTAAPARKLEVTSTTAGTDGITISHQSNRPSLYFDNSTTTMDAAIFSGTATTDGFIYSFGNVSTGMTFYMNMDQTGFHPWLQSLNLNLGTTTKRWTNIYLVNAPNVSSDARLKSNIEGTQYGLNEVLKLRPVSYKMKSEKDGNTHFGFIAQEVKSVIPEVVEGKESEGEYLSMRYSELIPVLTKAIQDQQKQIEDLKSQLSVKDEKVSSLEGSVSSMKNELDNIKRVLGLEAKANNKK